jgi:lipoyl(octanoyl) transferase
MEQAAVATPSAERAERAPDAAAPIECHWLGRVPYRDAWDLQKRLAAARAEARIGDQLLLLEHPAVVTLGRQAEDSHVLASPAILEARGIEVLRVERGGEVTYHGPGQLVAYPILRLADRGLLLRPYVRALEAAMTGTCTAFGVEAGRREGHPGCWVDADGARPRKIGALGIRVEQGVAYHGIALNVDVALADFELIDPCGMPGLVSSSIAAELGRVDEQPSTDAVADAGAAFATALAAALGDAPLHGVLPPDADPAAERAALERLLAARAA